jgi:hypothetical protein
MRQLEFVNKEGEHVPVKAADSAIYDSFYQRLYLQHGNKITIASKDTS